MQRRNYLHPGPPWGPGDEERRGGRKRRGCVDGQNGRMDSKVWADFGTATWGSGWQVEKSPSFTASLIPKDLRIKLGHDWNRGAVCGFWMLYVGWYFAGLNALYFKTIVFSRQCYSDSDYQHYTRIVPLKMLVFDWFASCVRGHFKQISWTISPENTFEIDLTMG